MVKHILFLRWWLFMVLVSLGTYIAYSFNVFHEVWVQDQTKLSYVILALFAIFSVWNGSATWVVSKALGKDFISEESLNSVTNVEDGGWFISDTLLNIGMIGTVCGFIIMLTGGFSGVDVSNPATVSDMLSKLSAGMSTALYTTLAGLVTSVLLKMQCFNLSQGIEKLRSDEEK